MRLDMQNRAFLYDYETLFSQRPITLLHFLILLSLPLFTVPLEQSATTRLIVDAAY
jgi:hypothetical protein